VRAAWLLSPENAFVIGLAFVSIFVERLAIVIDIFEHFPGNKQNMYNTCTLNE